MLPKLLWKRLAYLCTYLAIGLTVAFASTSLFAPAHAQTGQNQPFKVKVFIITTFSTEENPWLNNEKWPLEFKTPLGGDDHQTVYCQYRGVCLTIIGVDKVNAAASVTAILRDPQFQFSSQNSFFLLAGTASTSPYEEGTLGFTAWARWVVDWDQGYHLFPATVPGIPFGYMAPGIFPDSTSVFHLNEKLVQLAFKVTSHVQLQDSDAAIAERRKYPGQANQHPFVSMCDTITGDNIWAGAAQAQEAQYITDQLIKLVTKIPRGIGKNCTAESEDTAVAGVLKRFGYLDHYLSLRGASAFDQPYPGESLQYFVKHPFRVNDIATTNLYQVGSTMVNYLVRSQTSL